MQDQPSTSDDRSEPPRPGNLPEDFIWDPETQAWYASGEPYEWDHEAFSRDLTETIGMVREKCMAEGTWGNGTVIRMGPLPKIPQWMRKSLRNKPDHLPLFPDDDTAPTKQESTPCDPDDDEPSDEFAD